VSNLDIMMDLNDLLLINMTAYNNLALKKSSMTQIQGCKILPRKHEHRIALHRDTPTCKYSSRKVVDCIWSLSKYADSMSAIRKARTKAISRSENPCRRTLVTLKVTSKLYSSNYAFHIVCFKFKMENLLNI